MSESERAQFEALLYRARFHAHSGHDLFAEFHYEELYKWLDDHNTTLADALTPKEAPCCQPRAPKLVS